MKRAGVIGHPIAHSKSPLIHNYWLAQTGIAGSYTAHDIMADELRDLVLRLRDEGFAGVNITLPHKQHIMDVCTTLNDEAKKIGAVNTAVFYPNGEIEGRNTDAHGFITNAKNTWPDYDFRRSPALVLGAGGAARAILYALKREGVPEIRIANRTIEAAEELAEEFGATVYDWSEKDAALKDISFLVNTTALGMNGKPKLEMDLKNLGEDTIVYDIVYAPLMTDLLSAARQRGCRTVTGIGMLLYQAQPAFEAFFGVKPEVTEELVEKVLA